MRTKLKPTTECCGTFKKLPNGEWGVVIPRILESVDYEGDSCRIEVVKRNGYITVVEIEEYEKCLGEFSHHYSIKPKQ